jgi:Tfp pilus assembly protein PilO
MKQRTLVFGVVGVVAVVALWWFFVMAPIRSDADEVADETEQLRREESALAAQVAELRDIESRGPEIEAELAELREALPEFADLAEFVNAANSIAETAGITWLSVAPSEPVPTGGIGTVNMSIQVEGGYFQVLDYLNRLEELPRLVLVDTIGVTAAGAEGTGTFGAPPLTASLTARMFTLSTSAVDPGGAVAGDETGTGTTEGAGS